MQTEIEVKFLAVDHAAMHVKLAALGAVCTHPMRLMRRTVFDWPGFALEQAADGYLRVRDEGDKVTATYKQFNEALSIDGAKEVEITVGNYEQAIALFEAIGMVAKSMQESKRETWEIDDCEVVLDEWPWLKPFLEIEGPNQAAIKSVAQKLDLNWSDHVTGSVTVAYRSEYDIPRKLSIAKNPRIAFDDPVPDWMQKVRKTAA